MPGSSGNDAPKHFSNIRRARPSYSCENCRARRVKCDQVHPKCSNCIRNDVECTYATANPKRKDGPESASSSQSGGGRKPSRRQSDDVDSTQTGHLAIQSGGRSRYIEKTFWASVDSEGLELDSLLSDLPLFPEDDGAAREENSSALGVESERGASNFWMSAGSTAHAHPPGVCPRQLNLLRQLPPEQVCNGLYRVFLEGVHPLIPVLCTTTFEASYKKFWNWYDVWDRKSPATGILEENPSFLPLLLAVLFTGSLARTNTDDGGNYLLDAPACSPTALYRMALTSLTLVAFPQNPGLHSLMAYVLINSMIIREEEALSSCSFVALAIRVGQAMGLHKDPSQFKSLDPVQSNERRKLWCQLMHLDVMTACVSGLPLVISSEIFSTTRMLSELRDEHVGKRRESDSGKTSLEDRYPGYVLAVGRYDASAVMRKILVRQFSPDPLKLVHIRSLADQIEHLRSRTEFRIGRLKALQAQSGSPGPDSDRSYPSQSSISGAPSTTALIGWSIDLLQLMVEKAYCVLYQPIMSDAELWADTRQDAIPHYQEYVEIFLRMSTTEIYRPFQWLYPQSYQPLHPTAVLLIDSMKQPGSPEMARSQILIQNIFSLVGPEGRITNGSVNTEHGMSQFRPNTGAKRAWDRLEKLRLRVWNHMGLLNTNASTQAVGASVFETLPSATATYHSDQAGGFMQGGISDMGMVDSTTYPEADNLLFEELQSFSQAWFPPDFYAGADLYGNPSDSSNSQLDVMLPEATQFDWGNGAALDNTLNHGPPDASNRQDPFNF